jgi:hypothetical protein
MGGERKVYRVLMGKPEGKRPLGRPRCRWEDGRHVARMGEECVQGSDVKARRKETTCKTKV